MNIFVSSVAFKNLSIQEIDQIAIEQDFSIEFSANFDPSIELANQFRSLTIDRLPHNYFPPPETPFVLNLASQNEAILELSRNHCKQGIELASHCRLKYFSAHAGFCLDPSPESLGEKLLQPEYINRETNWDTFIDSCLMLSEEASKRDVQFLFENNVLMQTNMRTDGVNPLLCVEPWEILKVFQYVSTESLGFLLDTAHLKVSAKSLDFDMNEAVKELSHQIGYIHHSDNDGIKDSNEPLTDDYWFLKYMKGFNSIPHVLEVKNQSIGDIKNQISLLRSSI
ncbi:sugar phosphate isomerase/epimerase family protein [Ekhidna sp.]